MCRLHTEGTLHSCGHYIITKKLRKDDCNDRFCIFSVRHPVTNCSACPHCKRYLGPDASETITLRSPDYCRECEYWYNGPGARHQHTRR